MNTIERAMQQFDYSVIVDKSKFLNMSNDDRELLINSLSEKEKFENINNFMTLPNGKTGWNR